MTSNNIYIQFVFNKANKNIDNIFDKALMSFNLKENMTSRIVLNKEDVYNPPPEKLDSFGLTKFEVGYGPLRISISTQIHSYPRHRCDDLVNIKISESRFGWEDENREVDTKRCKHLIDLAEFLYKSIPTTPILVYSTSPMFEARYSPVPDCDETNPLEFPREYITWLDIYSPEEVLTIGKEKLLSAPAPRVEELKDGSILVASKHPLEEREDQLNEVSGHLDIPTWLDLL